MEPERIVPLFPLPNILLYPSAVLPLHIFEPRYRQLVEDLESAGERELVLGLLKPGWEDRYFEKAPVYPLAGLGRVLQVTPLSEGKSNILVQGQERVQILEEVPSDRLYRKVRIVSCPEPCDAAPAEVESLTQELRRGLIEFAEGSLLLPEKTSLAYMADVLLVALPLPVDEKQEHFAVLDVVERARRVREALEEVNRRRRELRQADRDAGPGRHQWN